MQNELSVNRALNPAAQLTYHHNAKVEAIGDYEDMEKLRNLLKELSSPKATLSFAKTLRGHKSRRVTMLQAHPHAIHFKHILYFGEGQGSKIRRGLIESERET
jgi:hypothetical protein